MSHDLKPITAKDVSLPDESGWNKLPPIAFGVGAVGIVLTMLLGGELGAFNYLVAYLFWLSFGFGALFFVLFQFITRAGWSVLVRRVAENAMITLPIFALLFVPILLNLHTLFSWTTPELFANDHLAAEMLEKKSSFLNIPFFLVRAGVYFTVWTALSWFFYSNSTAQDESGDHSITRKLQKIAAPGIALTVLTMTFAIFDWDMSTDWQWFSTMYGVYFFAGSMVAFMSLLAIMTLLLTKQGHMGGAVNAEHFQDIGKLLWGFTVFWSYIAFSQFFLIWYGNIPEETLWFAHRWEGSWQTMGWILAIGHFWVPLFLFMSRHIKRKPKMLMFFAIYMIVLHAVDLIWQILPVAQHSGFQFDITLVTAFVGIGGVFVGAMVMMMKRSLLVPLKDPRLPESRAFTNY